MSASVREKNCMHILAGSPGHCIPSMDYEQKERLRASQGPRGHLHV